MQAERQKTTPCPLLWICCNWDTDQRPFRNLLFEPIWGRTASALSLNKYCTRFWSKPQPQKRNFPCKICRSPILIERPLKQIL